MWMTIDKLHEYVKGRQMFVVRAFDVPTSCDARVLYTTDPYCTWLDKVIGVYVFPRWPHPFPPTHFCLLPNER
jgi:hypothetical protein